MDKSKKNEVLDTKMTFDVAGEEISLTPKMVMNYLTKGNEDVSIQEALMFMNLCKYQKLNPFLNEAYLVKYSKNQPAEKIVSKEAFMKRAESHPAYTGIKAGLILIRDKKITEVEGAFSLPSDTIVGGWAEVYRSDREFPTVAKVSMKEYSTGKSTWGQKPATMIRKVAIVQAQREAFPSSLGALYTDIEAGYESDQEPMKDIKEEMNQGEEISFDDQPDVVIIEDKKEDGLSEEEKKEALEAEQKAAQMEIEELEV